MIQEIFASVQSTHSAFAASVSVLFYGAAQWISKFHLSKEAKEELSLWLMGAYQDNWSNIYCKFFDSVFGENHLSFRCFAVSCCFSLLSVTVFFIFFSEVVNLFDDRFVDNESFISVFVLAIFLNLIPDYLSLLQTRAFLGIYARTKKLSFHTFLAMVDIIISALIIFLFISSINWIIGAVHIDFIEMIALYSFYSIFFYSTFFTSFFAIIYCLSTAMMRIFINLNLFKILDTVERPVAQLGLVSSFLVFIFFAGIAPVLQRENQFTASTFDEWLCSAWPNQACAHVVRLTKDEKRKTELQVRACQDGVQRPCLEAGFSFVTLQKLKRAFESLPAECQNELESNSCVSVSAVPIVSRFLISDVHGLLSEAAAECEVKGGEVCLLQGISVSKSVSSRLEDFEQHARLKEACWGGAGKVCAFLGWMAVRGKSSDLTQQAGVTFLQDSCDRGRSLYSCLMLSKIHLSDGWQLRDTKKSTIYKALACSHGAIRACEDGSTIKSTTLSILEEYCDFGHRASCAAMLYHEGSVQP